MSQKDKWFPSWCVFEYLSQWEWERKVDKTGCISMADYNRRVSTQHVGQIVKVRFDKEAQRFTAHAVDGTPLSRFTLPLLSKQYILGDGYVTPEQS